MIYNNGDTNHIIANNISQDDNKLDKNLINSIDLKDINGSENFFKEIQSQDELISNEISLIKTEMNKHNNSKSKNKLKKKNK